MRPRRAIEDDGRAPSGRGGRGLSGVGERSAMTLRPGPAIAAPRLAGPLLWLPGRYTRFYEWYAILAFLDIVLTWSVLRLGGAEANWIAQAAVQAWGVWGLIWIKAITVVAVVMIAEYVGRRRPGLGWGLAALAVALNLLPVVIGGSHLATLSSHASLPEYWVLMWQENALLL